MLRLRFFLLALLTLLPLAASPSLVRAQNARCFPETGFCMSGPIRAYWERNGGLAVFGYPISEQRNETIEGNWSGPVQWFERDRLEDHADLGVLAGRLGARFLELRGTPWVQGPGGSSQDADCLQFTQTGYSVCGSFRSYWEQHGGLERYGYPLGAPVVEMLEGKPYTVQYFERRRMEFHPENAATSYAVLLGLLGRAVYEQEQAVGFCPPAPAVIQATAMAYRPQIGCPSAGLRSNVTAAWQPFERGLMLWVQNEDTRGGKIYLVFRDSSIGQYFWRVFDDTYSEGELINPDVTAPAGLYVPMRGFGKLWRDNEWVRGAVGYATLPEQADTALVQPFDNGRAQMIYRSVQNTVLILFRPGNSGAGEVIERTPVP